MKPPRIYVLDHGHVTLRNLAGPTRRHSVLVADHPGTEEEFASGSHTENRPFDADDVDPAQAARLSFEQMDSDRTYEEDMKLNRYLLKNDHTSPFEMIQVWIEVVVPIFVDRQLVRHRTWRRSEASARYIVLPDKWYVPEVVGGKSKDKKQGQDDNLLPGIQAQFKNELQSACAWDYERYKKFLDAGVAPEHARMFLHLNHYVHWLGNVDLHNMFHFLRLRTHSHAQIEARKYAEAVVELLRPHLPGLMSLFDELVRRT